MQSTLRQFIVSSTLAVSLGVANNAAAQGDAPPAPPPAGDPAPPPAPPPPAAPPPAQPAPPPAAQPGYGAPPPGQAAYGQPQGQPGYGAPPPGQPGYGYGAPPPGQPGYGPPPLPVGVREHDGFFLRFGLGYAPVSAKGTTESFGTQIDTEISGGAASAELLIGGTPAQGLVVGGGVVTYVISDPTFEADGLGTAPTDDGQAQLSGIGVFGQYYTDPKGGLFLQAFLGYAQGSYEYTISGVKTESETGTGFMLAAAVGYDFWVADQWSLGPAFRFSYAKLTYDETRNGNSYTDEYSVTAPTLLFGVTYH